MVAVRWSLARRAAPALFCFAVAWLFVGGFVAKGRVVCVI